MLPFKLAPPITKGGGKAVPCVSCNGKVGVLLALKLVHVRRRADSCALGAQSVVCGTQQALPADSQIDNPSKDHT